MVISKVFSSEMPGVMEIMERYSWTLPDDSPRSLRQHNKYYLIASTL